ncbi:MAG: hypothetical protein FWC91_12705 [Defluviitaleaceae bacterium]|nr:hypothetical protein [Defluviitaleaceae bacterium]
MDIEALFRKPAFTQLDPAQVQLLKQFARDMQGKSTADIARLYMQVNQKITQIKPISSSQRNAIIETIRNALPEQDRQKVNGFIKMISR